MAMKALTFQLDDQVVTVELGKKITKRDLYGYAQKIVEKDGRSLQRGYLNADGQMLQRTQIDYAKLDPEGTPIEELIVEIDGESAVLYPSSFDKAYALESVPLETLIGFNVLDVFPLFNLGDIPPGLYQTEFSYRKTYNLKDTLLLVNAADSGFLLIGEPKSTTFVGLNVAYDFFDAETDDEEEDLDFSMV